MSAPIDEPGLEEDDGVQAAEYALGLLDAHERAATERRVLSDASFARDVETWGTRFAALGVEVQDETPPAGAWAAIERRLEDVDNVVELRLRRRLGFWRGATAAAGLVAASLAVALVWPRSPPATVSAPASFLAARLTSTGGATLFVAVLDPVRHQIVLTPAAIGAAPDRSPELWLIPAGGRPIALGVAAFGRSVRLSPGVGLGGASPMTLAVSIEPNGGSSTGQPTGPVVATGRTERL